VQTIEELNSIQRFDQGVVSGAEVTDEGYLKANAIVTRTGVFVYTNPDGSVRRELRHPDDVFEFDSLQTLKMIPITNGHPEQAIVNSQNSKELSIGFTGEKINTDGQYLTASLLISDDEGVRAVRSGEKRELSLGYMVELVREDGTYNGQDYDYRQTKIRYNHLAIVERGRAGPNARINIDSFDDNNLVACDDDYIASIQLKTEKKNMTDEKFAVVTLDGLEYKSSPEVAKAYEKTVKDLAEKNDSMIEITKELETLKADRDCLADKLEAATKVDHAAEIKEAVKARVALIGDAKTLLKNTDAEINLDDMSDVEIITAVVKERCPKANLDEASEVYIKARFDTLLEDHVEPSVSMAKQRELVAPKLDAKEEVSADEARKKMLDRLKNSDKNKK